MPQLNTETSFISVILMDSGCNFRLLSIGVNCSQRALVSYQPEPDFFAMVSAAKNQSHPRAISLPLFEPKGVAMFERFVIEGR